MSGPMMDPTRSLVESFSPEQPVSQGFRRLLSRTSGVDIPVCWWCGREIGGRECCWWCAPGSPTGLHPVVGRATVRF